MSSRNHKLVLVLLGLLSTCPAAALAQPADRSSQLQEVEQAVQRDGYAPTRLLALGQAQLAQGQLGPAIVSFERGLLLAPRDEALHEALTNARTRAGLGTQPDAGWLERIAQAVSLREWSLAAWGSCLVLALTLLGLTLSKRHKRLFGAGVLCSALTLACTGAATYGASQHLKTAYVLHEGSVLRQSPFPAATAIAQLQPGEAVQPRSEHADFLYVESERGESGWIRKQELAGLAAGAAGPT